MWGPPITASSSCGDHRHAPSFPCPARVQTVSLKPLHMDVTSLFTVVLDSSSCCNKGAQTGGLKQQEAIISCSWGWEPEIKVLAGPCAHWSLGRQQVAGGNLPCLPSFQEPQDFLGLWQLSSSLCLHLHMLSFLELCLCPDSPLIEISLILD